MKANGQLKMWLAVRSGILIMKFIKMEVVSSDKFEEIIIRDYRNCCV